jgi:hypothetical protein
LTLSQKNRIVVSTDVPHQPYIVVRPDQIDAVCQVLKQNNWSHTVSREAVQSEGVPVASVIHLFTDADSAAVQLAIDAVFP